MRPTTPCARVIYPRRRRETTLRDLVAEYRACSTEYQRNKRRVFKTSYTNHYRRGLIKLLGVLEFGSNNTAHRPVIEALDLIVRHAGASARFYPPGEIVVVDGVARPDWEDLPVEVDSRGRKRIVRTVYEACVLQALRDRLRCKEIWVVGAHEWRNPDEDPPGPPPGHAPDPGGLLGLGRHPDRDHFIQAQQPGQVQRVPGIGLDPIPSRTMQLSSGPPPHRRLELGQLRLGAHMPSRT